MQFTIEFTCREEYLPSPRHRKMQERQTTYTHEFAIPIVEDLQIVAYWTKNIRLNNRELADQQLLVFWKDGQFYVPNYAYLEDYVAVDYSHPDSFDFKDYFLGFHFESYWTKERNLEDFEQYTEKLVFYNGTFLVRIPEPRILHENWRSHEKVVLRESAWDLNRSYYSVLEKAHEDFQVIVPEVFNYSGVEHWRAGYRAMYEANLSECDEKIQRAQKEIEYQQERRKTFLQEIENSYLLTNGKRKVEADND